MIRKFSEFFFDISFNNLAFCNFSFAKLTFNKSIRENHNVLMQIILIRKDNYTTRAFFKLFFFIFSYNEFKLKRFSAEIKKFLTALDVRYFSTKVKLYHLGKPKDVFFYVNILFSMR